MTEEHSRIRRLRHRWDEEDAARDVLERQAKRAFWEQEANELFAPIEKHLTRLGRVLHTTNATVDIEPTWERIGEQKLRRSAKMIFRATAGYLPLDLTIEGTSIFYRNSRYRFPAGIEALIHVITADVEQFIITQRRARRGT